jgi:diketogulonate reductase-like aldo/keto reductase
MAGVCVQRSHRSQKQQLSVVGPIFERSPAWPDLSETVFTGKLRYIGVTNWDAEHLRIALDNGFHIVTNQVGNQVQVSRQPLLTTERGHQARLRALCHARASCNRALTSKLRLPSCRCNTL